MVNANSIYLRGPRVDGGTGRAGESEGLLQRRPRRGLGSSQSSLRLTHRCVLKLRTPPINIRNFKRRMLRFYLYGTQTRWLKLLNDSWFYCENAIELISELEGPLQFRISTIIPIFISYFPKLPEKIRSITKKSSPVII